MYLKYLSVYNPNAECRRYGIRKWPVVPKQLPRQLLYVIIFNVVFFGKATNPATYCTVLIPIIFPISLFSALEAHCEDTSEWEHLRPDSNKFFDDVLGRWIQTSELLKPSQALCVVAGSMNSTANGLEILLHIPLDPGRANPISCTAAPRCD